MGDVGVGKQVMCASEDSISDVGMSKKGTSKKTAHTVCVLCLCVCNGGVLSGCAASAWCSMQQHFL